MSPPASMRTSAASDRTDRAAATVMMATLVWMLLALALVAIAPAGARAAEAPPGSKPTTAEGMTALVSTRMLFPRPRAPLPIAITLSSDDPTPQPGTVHLTVFDGQQTLFTWTSPEWAVSRTPRTVDALLPPLPIDEDHEDLSVRLTWRGEGRTVAFEPMPLGNTGRGERPLTVALCTTAGVDARTALRAVALDRFLVVEEGDGRRAGDPEPDRANARVVPVRLTEAELPASAPAWCAYDLAVITGDALARMKTRQLTALETWVRGGGAVCVLPEGQLGEEAMAFLRRLGEGDGWQPGGDRLDQAGAWPRLLRPGIGRAAIAPGAFALDAGNEAAMRAAAAHLWRLRAEQARRLIAGAAVDAAAASTLDAEARAEIQPSHYHRPVRPDRSDENELPSLTHVAVPTGSSLTNLLIPARVSVIPFGVVCGVFLAFVLVVGPGDWFVLGWLRARRFTWVVFPLVAIAFTVLMVRLSQHYLGVSDHRQRLEIVDCGAGGTVARANAIELVFVGARADVDSELVDALWADLGRDDSGLGFRRNQEERIDAPAAFGGAVPSRYVVRQAIGQWDPRLRRSLAFAAPADLPFTLDRERLTPAGAPAYAEELAAAHGAHGPLYIATWHHGTATVLHGDPTALSERSSVRHGEATRDWVGSLSIHPPAGWFSLATAISPAGGKTYEDLPLHDPTDLREMLLVVAQRRGDRIWLVRRLYRLDPGATP